MKFRVPALLLAALTAMSVLVSCGGGTADTTPAGGQNADETAAAAEETAEVTTAPEYVSPGSDYEGATVTVACIDYVTSGKGGAWAAANYCEGYMPELNGDPLNDSIYERNRNVEEDLNVKVEVYSLSSFSDCLKDFQKPVLAGEDLIDYGLLNAGNLKSILGSGLVYDLNSFDIDFTASWWDQNAVKEMTLLGKMEAATGDISLESGFAPITYFFNKKLVEDFNLSDPYKLVYDGVWTLDKSFDMCHTVAGDINGDGQMGIEDRFGMLFEAASLQYMVQGGGVRYTKRNSDGLPELTLNGERTVSIVELAVPFMADKDTNILAGNYTGYNNTFTDLMLPMFIDNRGLFYNNQLLVALNLRNMDADFGILPTPKFDEAQDDYTVPYSTWWATFAVVPVTNGRIEMISDLLNAMGYYSKAITEAYIDVTVLNKTLRDEDSAAMVGIILHNRVHDIGCLYNWGDMTGIFSGLVSNKSTDFTSSYTKIEAKIQSAMDDTIALLSE